VYVCENVMVDVTPQWAAGAANGGCKCCKPLSKCGFGTKPVCTDTCRACRGKQQECGYACTCITSPVKCRNRKLQAGLVCPLKLEYFGPQKGWGVKACEFIKQGDFVIEYIGEVISQQEMERRSVACDEEYQYVFTLNGRGGAGKDRVKDRCYIDAHAVRNLAAFINFGCAPNLEPRGVRSLSGDKRLDRVAFYAKRDIEAGTELTYRRDADAVSKARRSMIECKCGAGAVCMGFL
jgi:histone-lysine N-methyltransferase SUV39H